MLILFFIAFAEASLVCNSVAIPPFLWEDIYPTIYAFNGFFQADGDIKILDPLNNVLLDINLNGSVWHQYFDGSNNLVGDLFLAGLAPVLVLSSRQTLNPLFLQQRVCQIFYPPSPENIIDSYSELLPLGASDDYMTSYYTSLSNTTFGQTFSNEYFAFDSIKSSAFSFTNTYATGTGVSGHYVAQAVNFRYVPISEAQATALGWSGSVANFSSRKGFSAGRGVIPVEVFTPSQQTLYGL
jgi:hypothetical protein